MLKLENLSKTYAKGGVKAVDGLNLEVKNGEIFGFLGPNGAGKSTTIKMITGVLQPDEGTIVLNGVDIKKDAYVFKHNFGYVPDNHATYEKLTGMEYINFMGSMYDVPKDILKRRAEEFIEKFSLGHAINDQIKSYSHGMKQKIVVIGALLHNPKLWILDEPMTGLDPVTMRSVLQFMRSYVSHGNTILFSSHDLNVVAKVCDRVVMLRKGKQLLNLDVAAQKAQDPNFDFEEYFLAHETKN